MHRPRSTRSEYFPTSPLPLFPTLPLAFAALALLLAAFDGTRAAGQEKRPNILFAIADDWSYPHTSAAGYRAVSTPAFDRVAREGIRFTQAFAASPGCSPSRAAILTGRPTWQLENAGTHASSFSSKLKVYPDLLEAAGYHVGLTGKGWGPGKWQAGGRTRNPAGPEYSSITLQPPAKGMGKLDYAGNFAAFLKARPAGKPFCFWYGGGEPHRGYEQGSGLRAGKKLADVDVPPFLPDVPEIRSDLLDYCLEIEWFDQHLGRMLRELEAAGELDNTIVVVTGDNGMSFPASKANVYDYGFHEPLAIRWGARVPGGRVVDDIVSFVDFAPTFLEAAGVKAPPETVGRSLMNVLTSKQAGVVDPSRDRAFTARERHSSARYNNWGFPSRALRTRDYLYIRNFHPERWPAGDPKALAADPAGGEDGGGGTGFFDIDGGPSKTYVVDHRDDPKVRPFFEAACAKRPAEQLFAVRTDPGCLQNLADDPTHAAALKRLRADLDRTLSETGDSRVGPNPEVWETYPRYSPIRAFPPPDGKG